MIEIRQLNKAYKEGDKSIEVFSNLNLEIPASTKNLILGTSGSGKSTFLNLIGALDRADSGEIIIAGKNISTMTEDQRTLFRRKHLGFIFQFFNLIPTLTVEENIMMPIELNKCPENKIYAMQLLEEVGLFERKDSFPENLSGGQQQRVAIVRALAHKPEIIIADEPTGNLDPKTADSIIKILDNLCAETKTTLIMASHNLELKSFADSVYEVREKRLDELS